LKIGTICTGKDCGLGSMEGSPRSLILIVEYNNINYKSNYKRIRKHKLRENQLFNLIDQRPKTKDALVTGSCVKCKVVYCVLWDNQQYDVVVDIDQIIGEKIYESSIIDHGARGGVLHGVRCTLQSTLYVRR